MRFYEKQTLLNLNNKTQIETHKIYEVEQPAFYRIQGKFVGWFDRQTYTRFKKPWAYMFRRLDEFFENRHRRTCNDDCGTWYRRLPEDQVREDGRPARIIMDEAHAIPGCVRMPLEARWDCWIYYRQQKHWKLINSYTLDKPA